MRVKGLNSREYSWNLSNYQVYENSDRAARSKYHLSARVLLLELFSPFSILEEVKLPGTSNRSYLYLDFYVPNLQMAVEVHGQQHYQYTPFFHKTKAKFIKAMSRDRDKEEWCEINGIKLVVLKYSETIDEWRERLTRC